VIGIILAAVALLLAYESKGLLVGESADEEMVGEITRLATADESVRSAGRVLTMHMGANDVLLNLELEFEPDLPSDAIHAAIHRVEDAITSRYPEVTRIFVELDSV